MAETKGLNLSVSLDENVRPFLGDAIRVQQIVWNLLSNAVKFTPKGGTVDISVEPENDGVKITVKDTGVGIKPEFLPHVFDLFRQADSRTNRSYGGLGLGLAIVRNLTNMHGGTARADSAGEGKGSTFEVILPPEPPAFESSGEPETRLDLFATDQQSIPGGARPLEGARMLVVDDDPDSREMLKSALTAYGGEVRTCGSSAEALKTVQAWMPDFLVSDIGMPDEDGYTLIKHIRELPAERGGNIPALALTGYATLDDHHRALAAGYQMHMAKPVELGRLAVVATRLLGRQVEHQHEADPQGAANS
jgi:CheY-like chemotaxis protein